MSETNQESRMTSASETPSRRTRRSTAPSETSVGATPSRRKSLRKAADERPGPEIEVTGAEDARLRHETARRLTKGKELEPPDIMSAMVPEMDDFFRTEKIRHEDVFELNYYKLHEDLQQAIMEYQMRVDHLKAKDETKLSDEERSALDGFKGQLSHLEQIFAHFTDNPGQTKKDAAAAYRSYLDWRQEGQSKALAEHETREASRPKKEKKTEIAKTETLRILEENKRLDDTAVSEGVKNALDVFLSLSKPTEAEIKNLRQKIETARVRYIGLSEEVAKSRMEAIRQAEPKRTDFLGSLGSEYFSKTMRLMDLEAAIREAYRKSGGLEEPRKLQDAIRSLAGKEERPEEVTAQPDKNAIEEGMKLREKSLRQDERKLQKQESELRAKIAEAFGIEPSQLPNRGPAIYGYIEKLQHGEAAKKAKSTMGKLWGKAVDWLTNLATGESGKTVDQASYRQAKEMSREITRIQAERVYTHDQLMQFEDYRDQTIQTMEESRKALDIMEREAEGKIGKPVETGIGPLVESQEAVPAFSVEWTKANLKDAAREWDEMAPTIQKHNLGTQVKEAVAKVADEALKYEELSGDYSSLRHLQETIEANQLYATCPEAAMAICLEALPKPKLEADRRVKEAADKAVVDIKRLIAEAKASEPQELTAKDMIPEENEWAKVENRELTPELDTGALLDEFKAWDKEKKHSQRTEDRAIRQQIGQFNAELELIRQSRKELKQSLSTGTKTTFEKRQHTREERALKAYDEQIAKLEATIAGMKNRFSAQAREETIAAAKALATGTEPMSEEAEELEPEEETRPLTVSQQAPPPPSAVKREEVLDLQAAISGRPRKSEKPSPTIKATAEPDFNKQPRSHLELLAHEDEIKAGGWYQDILRNNPLIAKHHKAPKIAEGLQKVKEMLADFDARKTEIEDSVATAGRKETLERLKSLAVERSEAMTAAIEGLQTLAQDTEDGAVDVEVPMDWREIPENKAELLSAEDRTAILNLLPEKARPAYEKTLEAYLAAIEDNDRKAVIKTSEALLTTHLKHKIASEDAAIRIMQLAVKAAKDKNRNRPATIRKPRTMRAKTLRGSSQ